MAKGTIVAINMDGTTTSQDVSDPNILGHLRRIVGGHMEVVPLWDRFRWEEVDRRCVVFCNEEGKLDGLGVNERATAMWYACMGGPANDYLVGNIAVVFGDLEFMSEI